MTLKKAYNLTKAFSKKSYHYGTQDYTPSSTDKISYLQHNGNELTIYLNINKEDNTSVKMRFGEAYEFINRLMSKTIIVDGRSIVDSVYTSQGLVSMDEFKEAEDIMNNIPQPFNYEEFLTESVPLKDLYDNVYILETGEIALYFKVNTSNRFPGESQYLLNNKEGKRMFAKVLLNEEGKFEVVETPRVRKSEDKVLSLYPDAILSETLNSFIVGNN